MGASILKIAIIGILPSPIKILYYRLSGAKIGKGVSIGLFSVLNCNQIEIGDNTKIGMLTYINVDSLKLGKRVKIEMLVRIKTGVMEADDDAIIYEQVTVGGLLTPRSKLSLGKRVQVLPHSFLNPTEPIIIEDDVGTGGATHIFTHAAWQSVLDGYPSNFGPVTIKKGTWFGWRVFVLPNVTVGEYATVMACSLVGQDIGPKSLAGGVPARTIKTGDGYIKTYTTEEKNKMVHDILKEYAAFVNYKYRRGYHIDVKADELVIKDEKQAKIVVFGNSIEAYIDAKAVISLSKMPDELCNRFIAEKKIWFDLEAKRTFYIQDPLWTELKDYFSRYGIRFDIES